MTNPIKKEPRQQITDSGKLREAIMEVYSIRSKLTCGNDYIVMFAFGRYGLVVGKDVDAIYMRYGWDFANVQNSIEGCSIPYILILPEGRQYLANIRANVLPMSSRFGISMDLDDFIISFVQQKIDYLRSSLVDKEIEIILEAETVTIQECGFLRRAVIDAILLSESSFCLCLDNNENIVIAQGKDWKLNKEVMALLFSVDFVISKNKYVLYKTVLEYSAVRKEQSLRNKDTYRLFSLNRRKTDEDVIILVKERGFFVSFDDDALRLSSLLGLKLYTCKIMGTRNHTVIAINTRQYQRMVEMGIIDFKVLIPNEIFGFYDFGFSSSMLNFKGRKDVDFKSISVLKGSDGTYSVQAIYSDGTTLSRQKIPTEYGFLYHSLPVGKEKTMLAQAIAHKYYDSKIQ